MTKGTCRLRPSAGPRCPIRHSGFVFVILSSFPGSAWDWTAIEALPRLVAGGPVKTETPARLENQPRGQVGWQKATLALSSPGFIKMRHSSAVLILLAVGLLLTGCSDDKAASGGAPGGGAKYRIAVIPKGTTHDFWKSVHYGAQQAADE